MDALRAFAKSVGFVGDIMADVVTKCAGGAIEEIHWRNLSHQEAYLSRRKKDLDGTLPVGDLNMPKLRVLNLSGNGDLKGGRESERVGCSLGRVVVIFIYYVLAPHAFLHSSLSSSPRFLPFSYLVALCSFSQVTLRSCSFPWV
jgi:hypothetical protein